MNNYEYKESNEFKGTTKHMYLIKGTTISGDYWSGYCIANSMESVVSSCRNNNISPTSIIKSFQVNADTDNTFNTSTMEN